MAQKSNQERNRYGVCRNDSCSKSKDKEPQVIPSRKEFVCSECGRPLREVPRPKSTWEKYGVLVIVFVTLVIVGIGGYLMFSGRDKISSESSAVSTDNGVRNSTVPIAENASPQDSQNISEEAIASSVEPREKENGTAITNESRESPSGSLKLSYGQYSGDIKGGYPHGQGRLTYTTSRQINRNDIKGRTANAGDYVIGEFYNGFVVYGKHYDSKGNLLESLNFGIGSEDSYETK